MREVVRSGAVQLDTETLRELDAPPDVDAPAPSLPRKNETPGHATAPEVEILDVPPVLAPKMVVYLLGAGLSWCCGSILAVQPEHLVVDLAGRLYRVRRDLDASPRRARGSLLYVVTITSKRPYDPRRPR